MTWRRVFGALPWTIAMLVVLLTAWLAVGVSGSFASASPSGLRITIKTFAPYYSPTSVHVNSNTSVSWTNPTAALHSITHDDCKDGPRCVFDSGPLGPDGTFTLHQLPPGSYSYHCTFHPIMRGVLVVTDPERPNDT